MAASTSYSADPTLYLYTSLTAGSSHIITATSRLETILKANKIPFRALDCATDEKARMLWGRRARGRKLPGLVKYGSVIGDLEQIEEWNEYGELKEQIDASQEFGNLNVTSNIPPEKAPSDSQRSDPPSRAPSETRHISISDPKDKEKDKETSDSNPASSLKSTESPMTMAMRQVGAEAAAKAGQKKTSSTGELKAAPAPIQDNISTAKTPTVAGTKLSANAEDPSSSAEVTAAKMPALLAAEGAPRTSVDKINDPDSSGSTSPMNEGSSSSIEEQLLDLRRNSSTTKTKSKLSESVSVDKGETVLENTSEPLTEVKTGEEPERKSAILHRGSSVEAASIEEIRAMEEKNKIQEEEEDEGEDVQNGAASATSSGATAAAATAKPTATTTTKEESESTDVEKPQEKDAKDAEATGVSVGD